MNNRYTLQQTNAENGEVKEMEFKTLKEISEKLSIEIHLIRKINKMSQKLIDSKRPHHLHREMYDTIKIFNIKKVILSI
jgi:hypothetical protein